MQKEKEDSESKGARQKNGAAGGGEPSVNEGAAEIWEASGQGLNEQIKKSGEAGLFYFCKNYSLTEAFCFTISIISRSFSVSAE